MKEIKLTRTAPNTFDLWIILDPSKSVSYIGELKLTPVGQEDVDYCDNFIKHMKDFKY